MLKAGHVLVISAVSLGLHDDIIMSFSKEEKKNSTDNGIDSILPMWSFKTGTLYF